MTKARKSSLSKANAITFESDWDYVISRMQTRGEARKEIGVVQGLKYSAVKNIGFDLMIKSGSAVKSRAS